MLSQNGNKLTAKTVLVAPDGTRMNAEYSLEAVNTYYRMTAVSVSVSVNVTENIPPIELLGASYAPLWYAVEKGTNRVYYSLNTSVPASGINAVVRDPKGQEYANSMTEFGDMYMYNGRAVISVRRNGIYDILAVDLASGRSTLLGGDMGLANVAGIVTEMVKTGTSYPCYGARMLGASPNGARVLYLVSDAVNALPARYYVYDLITGQSTELCSSLSGSRADISKLEHFEWMTSSRVRISVWETQGVLLKNNVYECVLAGGKWSVVKTNYHTDGVTWTGTGGADITEDPEITEELTTEPPVTDTPIVSPELPDDYLSLWTDTSGAPEGVGMTLEEIAAHYYQARLDAIAKLDNYTTRCNSKFTVTLRADKYIMMTEEADLLNAEGERVDHIKYCQNICEYKNGEWVWTKLRLP